MTSQGNPLEYGSPMAAGGEEPEWKFMNEFWFHVTFIYRRHDVKEHAYLAGDFSGWQTDVHEMKKCTEGYSVTLLLAEGFYSYKFYVDGSWVHDEHNPHRSRDFDNSVVFVHMDPKVYGIRPQHPPHRDYHRPHGDGSQFQVLCPKPSPEILVYGILERLIFVYLPPSYYLDPNRCYPVVYAQDGQNIFSTPEHAGGPCRGGWYLDAKLDHFWSQGVLPEFILVSVPNSDFVCIGNRQREYCTTQFKDTAQDPFIQYLTEVVKKEVDDHFRTLPDPQNTVAVGASMGGLFTFVLALTHSHFFATSICMSPSFWYVDQTNSTAYDLVRSLRKEEGNPPCRVYIDSGDGLGDNMYETKKMREVLVESGWEEGQDFVYHLDNCEAHVDMGVTHSESVWRERVHLGLKFALSRQL